MSRPRLLLRVHFNRKAEPTFHSCSAYKGCPQNSPATPTAASRTEGQRGRKCMRLSLSGPQFPKMISQHALWAFMLEDSEIGRSPRASDRPQGVQSHLEVSWGREGRKVYFSGSSFTHVVIHSFIHSFSKHLLNLSHAQSPGGRQ